MTLLLRDVTLLARNLPLSTLSIMLNVPFVGGFERTGSVLGGLLLLVFLCVPSAGVSAQVRVAPSVERSDIEILRGTDIVQPQAVFYKYVPGGDDPAVAKEDSVGVLRVPRTSELDAIPYRDRLAGYAVNVQHAMIVADGQAIDVQVSDHVARGIGKPAQEELFLFRPPADDAFDVAVPDGLDCKRLVPNSDEDLQARGRLSGPAPCKQVPGVETVVDVAAWYDAAMTNSISGIRAQPGPRHNARELRGRLRSLAPGGEKVRFAIVATPPPIQQIVQEIALGPTPILLDTVVFRPTIVFSEEIQRERMFPPGFEWVTTVAALLGPNWGTLPGRADLSSYRANRYVGDFATTLRWRANGEVRYDLTLFGKTQPTFSDRAPGNHHAVPYGVRLGARFGEADEIGMDIRLQGIFEDDPFQRTTLSTGDQRVRLLVGLDRGTLPRDDMHWRLSVGPTYFVDRPNEWEERVDARQLGYNVEGELSRLLRVKRFATILDLGAQVTQSWGYISDAGNRNLDMTGVASMMPRFRLANTYLAIGPVIQLSRTSSNYAVIEGFDENNVQFGLQMKSAILF